MIEQMECPGCGWKVEVVEIARVDPAASVLYDKEPGAWVRQARELRIGSKAVLHHLCSNPQLRFVKLGARERLVALPRARARTRRELQA